MPIRTESVLRGLTYFFAAILIAGAGLWLAPQLTSPKQAASPAATAAEPKAEGFGSKAQFLKVLRPAEDAAAGGMVTRFFEQQRRCFRLDHPMRMNVRMTRTLEMGAEFDAALSIYYRFGDPAQIRVDINPSSQEPWTYLAELRGDKVTSVQLYSPQIGAFRSLTASDPDASAYSVVTIGDLPLLEALGFYSLPREELAAAGYMDTMDSHRMAVIAWTRRIAEPGDDTANSALFYVEPDSSLLRTVRVFDAQGRLLRLFEDVDFGAEQDPCRPRGFRLTALAQRSHSAYRVLMTDGETPVDASLFSPEAIVQRGARPAGSAGAPQLP